MQLVQTLMRRVLLATLARTDCRLTFQRRRVLLFACETLLPNCGPLPQSSHLAAITNSSTEIFAKFFPRTPANDVEEEGEVVGTRRFELLTSTVSR